MDTSQQLGDLLKQLERQIQADVDHNTHIGPEWLVLEGERVLELAAALPVVPVELLSLLGGTSLAEFLGEGWLGCHAASRALAEQVQQLLSRHNAA